MNPYWALAYAAGPLPLIQYCFRTYGSGQDAIAALDASVDLRWNCGMRRSPVGVYTSVYVADKPASAPACEEKTRMRLCSDCLLTLALTTIRL